MIIPSKTPYYCLSGVCPGQLVRVCLCALGRPGDYIRSTVL